MKPPKETAPNARFEPVLDPEKQAGEQHRADTNRSQPIRERLPRRGPQLSFNDRPERHEYARRLRVNRASPTFFPPPRPNTQRRPGNKRQGHSAPFLPPRK